MIQLYCLHAQKRGKQPLYAWGKKNQTKWSLCDNVLIIDGIMNQNELGKIPRYSS